MFEKQKQKRDFRFIYFATEQQPFNVIAEKIKAEAKKDNDQTEDKTILTKNYDEQGEKDKPNEWDKVDALEAIESSGEQARATLLQKVESAKIKDSTKSGATNLVNLQINEFIKYYSGFMKNENEKYDEVVNKYFDKLVKFVDTYEPGKTVDFEPEVHAAIKAQKKDPQEQNELSLQEKLAQLEAMATKITDEITTYVKENGGFFNQASLTITGNNKIYPAAIKDALFQLKQVNGRITELRKQLGIAGVKSEKKSDKDVSGAARDIRAQDGKEYADARLSKQEIINQFEDVSSGRKSPFEAKFSEGSFAKNLEKEGYVCGPNRYSGRPNILVMKSLPNKSIKFYAVDIRTGEQPKNSFSGELSIKDQKDTVKKTEQNRDSLKNAIAENPQFNEIRKAGQTLSDNFGPMVQLLAAAKDSNKPAALVDYVKGLAQNLQNSPEIKNLKQNVAAARAEIDKLRGLSAGIKDEFEKQIIELEDNLDKVVTIVDSGAIDNFCKFVSNPANWDESTFKNWFTKDGIVMLASIATAVVAIAAITAISGGALTLPAIAAMTTLAGMAGGEVGYALSDSVGKATKGKNYSNKSLAGQYATKEGIFNPETGKYEQVKGSDVAKNYTQQFAIGFATTFAAMGLGKALGESISVYLSKPATGPASKITQNLLRALPKIGPKEAEAVRKAGLTGVVKDVFRQVAEECGEETFEQTADSINPVLGFIATVIDSMNGGVQAKFGKYDLQATADVAVSSPTNISNTFEIGAGDFNTFSTDATSYFLERGYKCQMGEGGSLIATIEAKTENNGTIKHTIEFKAKPATESTAKPADASTKPTVEPEAAKKDPKMEKAEKTAAGIRDGTIKGFDNYEGIRDLAKSAKIDSEGQLQLAKQFLENSGQKIESLINMDETVGHMKDVKIEGAADVIIKGGEGVEKVLAKLDNAKSLTDMDAIISEVANPAEKQMLENLANDLKEMKEIAIDEGEKVAILKESTRYLKDYKAAMKEGGMGSVKSSQEIFNLIRDNQVKLAHQTIVDRKYFTGSDHGVTHILDANMAMADKIFADMGGKLSAMDKVLVRQAILDHDMGYTISALEGAKGGKYFAMTKDHPLYSTILAESKKAEYVKHFGEQGYETIREAILDHSDVSKLDLTVKGSELVKNIVSGVDCLGTTADIKMMKLFREPEMMADLLELQELSEELKTTESPEEKVKIIENMKTVHSSMMDFVEQSKISKSLKESYLKALANNFDPTDPEFAFKRDFGSHSAGFEGIQVAEDGSITVNMSITENFKLIREMFAKGDEVSTSALAKAMDEYGLKIGKSEATVTKDGKTFTGAYSEAQFAEDLAAVERGEIKSFSVKTPKATFNFTKNAEKGKELSSVLRREQALKKAVESLKNPETSPAEMREALEGLKRNHNLEGYVMGDRPASGVIEEVHDLIGQGKQNQAVELLEQLRLRGTRPSG